MRAIIVLLLMTTSALALQGISRKNAPTSVAPPPGYQGPGDIVSGAVSWYGLRGYTAAYNGPLIRLHRLSDDDQCDINVGLLAGRFGNTANCEQSADNNQTADAFCNATTCVVVALYDQAGGGNALGQSIVSSQPTLTFNCLGNLPCITFVGVQQFVGANVLRQTQPFTITLAANYTGTAMGEAFSAAGNEVQLGYGAFTADDIYATAGTLAHISGNSAAFHAVQFNGNDPASFLTIDGTANAITVGTNGFSSKPAIGAMVAQFVEAGVWPQSFSPTQQAAMNGNMHNYWGF